MGMKRQKLGDNNFNRKIILIVYFLTIKTVIHFNEYLIQIRRIFLRNYN